MALEATTALVDRVIRHPARAADVGVACADICTEDGPYAYSTVWTPYYHALALNGWADWSQDRSVDGQPLTVVAYRFRVQAHDRWAFPDLMRVWVVEVEVYSDRTGGVVAAFGSIIAEGRNGGL